MTLIGDEEDVPGLTGYDRPYRLENWPPEDLESYVGGPFVKREENN
ncbi:hypothetical protein [Amycolatopsis sp.]|nr:hypothetical protein [Amycolatopsis sp.]HVV11622.1 hypothetical protein [Amycolatopsis sp.]